MVPARRDAPRRRAWDDEDDLAHAPRRRLLVGPGSRLSRFLRREPAARWGNTGDGQLVGARLLRGQSPPSGLLDGKGRFQARMGDHGAATRRTLGSLRVERVPGEIRRSKFADLRPEPAAA